MPEGDTIHRAANRLRPALAGYTLVRFEAARLVGDRPALGSTIDAVEAQGKNLLVHFADGISLRTHMKMTGSWHLYREGERWQKGAYLARAVVGADSGWVAVCFQAPVVETYHRARDVPMGLRTLGPDLTSVVPHDEADRRATEAVARAATIADRTVEVAEVLLDQRVAAGIGNVYKSEVLFLHGIDPFTPLVDITDELLARVFRTAHDLLVANLDRGRRVTYRGGVAVYGRRGQPCRRCGTPVAMRRQGPMARTTYWCPTCQPRPRRRRVAAPDHS